MPENQVPQIPGYRFEKGLGQGGFGRVFRARHLDLDREVVVKFAPRGSREDEARFRREAECLAAIKSTHVLELIDFGLTDDHQYLVYPFWEGGTLRDRLERDGPLSFLENVDAARQMLQALHTVHDAGIVHRDLKPGNVLITPNGLKLFDFGIGMILDRTRLTRPGEWIGSYRYAAPEQFRAEEPDPRTDLYAFGWMLRELATGQIPYEHCTIPQAYDLKMTQPVADLPRLPDGYPSAFDEWTRALVAPDRARRTGSARAAGQELDVLVSRLDADRSGGSSGGGWRKSVRGAGGLLAGGILAGVLLAGGILAGVFVPGRGGSRSDMPGFDAPGSVGAVPATVRPAIPAVSLADLAATCGEVGRAWDEKIDVTELLERLEFEVTALSAADPVRAPPADRWTYLQLARFQVRLEAREGQADTFHPLRQQLGQLIGVLPATKKFAHPFVFGTECRGVHAYLFRLPDSRGLLERTFTHTQIHRITESLQLWVPGQYGDPLYPLREMGQGAPDDWISPRPMGFESPAEGEVPILLVYTRGLGSGESLRVSWMDPDDQLSPDVILPGETGDSDGPLLHYHVLPADSPLDRGRARVRYEVHPEARSTPRCLVRFLAIATLRRGAFPPGREELRRIEL